MDGADEWTFYEASPSPEQVEFMEIVPDMQGNCYLKRKKEKNNFVSHFYNFSTDRTSTIEIAAVTERDKLEQDRRVKSKLVKYCALVVENEMEDQKLLELTKRMRDHLQSRYNIEAC